MTLRLPLPVLATLVALALASADASGAGPESKRVKFAKGAASSTVTGAISGDRTVDYKVRAKAGQMMSVSLDTSNPSLQFNVLPPKSDTALFVGSSSGSKWSGALPASGDTTIRVYLMRNAARRGEAGQYKLTIGLDADAAKR